jgi:extracellular factor (EF) 3-hydroxypalmitic acid methyl ester biosynthesis protein
MHRDRSAVTNEPIETPAAVVMGPWPETPAAVPARVRRYEELDGAAGRAVFFRPQRYTAADLAPLCGTVIVNVAGVLRRCAMHDVSQNGVAFIWPSTAPVHERQRLDISLRFDAHEAFRGEAHVGSVRLQGGATIVGVSFEGFLLDVDELLQLRTIRQWEQEGAIARVPWRTAAGDRFRALVAELRLYLQDAQQRLDALEAQLPWHVLQTESHPVRAALMSELRGGFVAEATRLTEEIDAAVRCLPDAYRNADAKEWSLRHVQDLLMQSPGLHRCRHKPFGYPGDYEVMNFLYERHFDGQTLFARALTLAFCHSRPGSAVRARKDLVKKELTALLQRSAGSGEPVRVLSIAAGPAQELHELFLGLTELPAPLEVVLFEQDKNALAHAWRRLKHSASHLDGRVGLTFLHDSVKRLLRDPEIFAPFGSFDLVYCCGMFDYFQRSTAVVLARRLAAAVRPGGKLLVANMTDNAGRWLLDFHLDWPLIYRRRDELLDLGARAVPGAKHRIVEEESGANPFLELVP